MRRFVGKPLARLLCGLLALLLPFSALAQSPGTSWLEEAWEAGEPTAATVSFTPGEALRDIPAAADLLEVLSFRLVAQKGGLMALALLASGQEAISFAFRGAEEGLYLHSQALGGDVLFFGWEQMREKLRELEAQGVDIAPGLQSFDSLRDALSGEPAGGGHSGENDPLGWDEAMRQALAGDEAARQWVEDLARRLRITPGEFTAPHHDPATQRTELVLTQEDLLALLNTSTVRKKLLEQLAATEPSLTPREAEAEVDRLLKEGREGIQDLVFQAPVTLLEKDGQLVSLSLPLTLDEASASTGSPQGALLDMPITYHRLTAGGVRTHCFQTKISSGYIARLGLEATAVEEGENWKFKAVLEDFANTRVVLRGHAQAAENTFSLSAVANGRDIFGLQAASFPGEAEDAQELTFLLGPEAMALLLNASAPASPARGLEPLLTLRVRSAAFQGQGDPFAVIRQAQPDTSLQLLAMTEEDRTAFFEKTFNSHFLQAVFKLMSLMPASVMELLTQEMW